MKQRINFGSIAGLVLGILGVFGLLMFTSVLGLVAGAGVVLAATAQATIADAVTTEALGDASPNLLRPEISKLITQIRRDNFPLDTIMREIGKVSSISSNEWKFYQKDERGLQDKVTSKYTFLDALTADLTVDAAHMWAPHDVVLVPGVNGGDGKKLRALVSRVDISAGKITLTPINGRTSADASKPGDRMPAIADASLITRIGNAHNEVDAQTTPVEIAPYDTYNYSQIFMAQVEESLVAKRHLKEVDINIMDYKEDAIIDMRAQAENAMLFGYPKKEFYDPVLRKKLNLVGGADFFITKTKEYAKNTAIDNKTFNAWAKYIFTGNNGSDRRILFAGNTLLERIMNADIVRKQLEAKATEIVAGIRFNKIETGFGELLIRRHQIFEEIDGYTDNGLVLDMQHIERGYLEPTHTQVLDLDKTGQKRVDAIRILENWSMKFTNLDTHCWIIGT